MNFTELARKLRISPQELREKLPLLGIHIGAKAIKVDSQTAQKIIQNWPWMMEKLKREKEKAESDAREQRRLSNQKIEIPQYVNVRDFAVMAGLPVNKILAELMKNGIFISLNEKMDFDTASIIGSDLGIEVVLKENEQVAEDGGTGKQTIEDAILSEKKEDLNPRSPVIVVMGHVDHGKTKLLDAIRRTDVVATEAGGITQHIGAYQVERRGRPITFIDTPGHEAFTAMRSRGARIADIAILVVAADDGVMPQTIEAYRIIESSKIPFIVAINKIDKPDANLEKTKQELSSKLSILPEDWGGKTICAPVSAKEGTGIIELLDMVLLTADMIAGDIVANESGNAIGTIIESKLDKGEGAVATLLVQNGTLRIGDDLCLDGRDIGRVRALKNYRGEKMESAGPSTPAKIIGLKAAPAVGDIIKVGKGEKMSVKKYHNLRPSFDARSETKAEENPDLKKLCLIIKSDVLGSAEAIQESLEKISTGDVKAEIISKGLGNISDGDIRKAEATGALILGFNVKFPGPMEELARSKNVEIKLYSIIYDLINEVKQRMEDLLEPEIVRHDLGMLKIAAIFKTEKTGQIVGGKVIEGKIMPNANIEVMRNNEIITTGKAVLVKSGKEDISEAVEGEECGTQYEGEPIIQPGDILKFYKEEKTVKKL